MPERWNLPSQITEPIFKASPGAGTAAIPEGTNVLSSGEVFSPVMVLKEEAIKHNLRAMAEYCKNAGVELAMHGKTSLSPELTQAQLDSGAWGISAATPSQVRLFRAFGVKNILLANELVDPAGIRWIAKYQSSHPDSEFLCYVDSIAGVQLLESVLAKQNPPVILDVLLEVSAPGGRTGARNWETTASIARAVGSSRHLRLVGVSGYEGALAGDRSEASTERIRTYCRQVSDIAARLNALELFDSEKVILSLGGGAFFEIVVEQLTAGRHPDSPQRVIIRSGSYLSHDSGLYARISAFSQPGSTHTLHPALELWGRVLSRPEPTLAFIDFGRRDAPFDQGMPLPQLVRSVAGDDERPATGFTLTALNDQHAYLTLPADDPLTPGDWVGSGISHPCTAFDKWRQIPVVNDAYTVVGSVTTYF